jgi:uncharacterized membrane-anchored protein
VTSIRLSPGARLAIVVAIQVFVLLGIIGFKQYTVWTGTTVLLETAPVDPRDPFRGDYFTVRYGISTLPQSLMRDPYIEGNAYIELKEGEDGVWEAVAIHDDRERSFDDTVLIKGKPDYEAFTQPNRMNFKYGIEELFIPEGSGVQLRFEPDQTVAVELKVDRFGNAVPRHFVVDGERVDLERR